MDVIFPSGGMGGGAGINLYSLVDHESRKNIRVCTFTDEEMLREKLDNAFGEHEWDESILSVMVILIQTDLEYGHSWQYNGPIGLLDLYMRAGGVNYTDKMNAHVVEHTFNAGKTNPLIKDLRRKFNSCKMSIKNDGRTACASPMEEFATKRKSARFDEKKDTDEPDISTSGSLQVTFAIAKFKRAASLAVRKAEDSISYDEFFHGFLAPYHTHTANIDPLSDKTVRDAISFVDSDGSGRIEWRELLSRALWVIENADKDEMARWTLRNLLNGIFTSARMEETSHAIFLRENQGLINRICTNLLEDECLRKSLKTRDPLVLKAFLTRFLLVGSTAEADLSKPVIERRRQSLNIVENTWKILFNENAGYDTFDILVEHIERNKGTLNSFSRSTLKQSIASRKSWPRISNRGIEGEDSERSSSWNEFLNYIETK